MSDEEKAAAQSSSEEPTSSEAVAQSEPAPDPQAPAAPTEQQPRSGNERDMPERLARQQAKFDEKLAAQKAQHDAAIAEIQAKHDEQMSALRTALGIEAEADPTEAAEARAQKAEKASRKQAFTIAAIKAGVPAERINDAFVLANVDKIAIDDDGNATGAEEVVGALITERSYLKGAQSTVGTATSPEPNTDPDPFDKTTPAADVRKQRASLIQRAKDALHRP